MTKKRFIVFLLLTLLLTAAIAEGDSPRVLVAFLSRAGENYNVGVAREGSASAAYAGYIEKGSTAMMAAVIADLAGGIQYSLNSFL